MAENPVAGWYADPADSTRERYWDGAEWTKRTRGVTSSAAAGTPSSTVSSTDPFGTGAASAQPAPVRTGTIAAIALGVLVAVGAGVAVAMSGGDSPQPRPTDTSIATSPDATRPTGPAPSPTVSGAPVDLPAGWVVETAQLGSFTFQRGPHWWDASEPDALDTLLAEVSPALPGARADYGGLWFVAEDEADLGEDVVVIIALAADSGVGSLRLETSSFVRGGAQSLGADDLQVAREEAFVSAQGLEGYVIDHTYTADGEVIYSSVVGLRLGDTMYFIQGVSWNNLEGIVPTVADVSDSLVPQFPL